MEILRKYNTESTIYFPLVDFGASDFETTPVTFASGDTKIIKDGGVAANTTNNPAYEGSGIYSLTLTATEMAAGFIQVTLIDQTAPKAWEDQFLALQTFGNASAGMAFDLDTATQDVNVASTDDIDFSATQKASINSECDTAISDAALATASALATVDANVDSILEDTATTIPVAIAGLNDFNPSTDTVARVTLVDVCTTNTDMRGTDSAFLAAGAPTNFADLAITAITGLVSVGTNNDKSGYSISGTKTTLDALNDISAAQVNSEVDTAITDAALATASALATVDTNVDAILVDTGTTLPTTLSTIDTNLNSVLTDTGTTIPAQITALNDISASDILDATIEGSITLTQSLQLSNASLAGKVSGAGTSTVVIRDLADSKDRITATVDADGNRTAVTRSVD